MRQTLVPAAPIMMASWLIGTISLLGWMPSAAVAQIPGSKDKTQLRNVFLPAPRMLRQNLTRAKKALDEQRYSDAVLELGALLTASRTETGDLDGQDYFVGQVSDGKPLASLKAQALKLLGSMPAKGRELFELQYGVDARNILEQAVSSGDIEKLNEVTRRYFHTKAGYEAALLLGRHHLDRGEPLAAALSFKRVAETGAVANNYEPELSVLLASCWLSANMPNKAQATLVSLRRRQPNTELRVGRQEVKLFKQDAQALPWLKNLIRLQDHFDVFEQVEWTMFRGNAQRNAASRGSMPLLNARWRVHTVNNPSDEKLVRDRAQDYRSKDLAALPVMSPLAIDNVVLMRTPQRLLAVDFVSGKRIWEFPWLGSADDPSPEGARRQGGAGSPRVTELNQRLWEDAAYGQVSSDGESVFLLDKMGYANTGGYMSPFVVVRGGQRQPNPNWPQTHNELVALDLRKEGKLRWIVGNLKGGDEPKLAGAFFLGPPLPLMGRLYVLAEVNGEIRLMVLDARRGNLLWSQQLAHVDQRKINQDGSRRLAGASPSFADGVLICPTSAGAVVAVNVATRSLLWGYTYKQQATQPRRFGFSTAYNANSKPVGQRWTDATATIIDGRVVVSPIESDAVYCLDLLSGELQWKQDRNDFLYVACVDQGNVVLVGKTKVQGIRLDTGKPAWSKPLALEDRMPAGRGFLSDGHYYLPATHNQLLKIKVVDGQVASEVQTSQPLGNLICYNDQIISQGIDWLAAFHQCDPLRGQVAERLKKNPQDAWALARFGEIALQDGDRQQALDSFRRAYSLDGEDTATRNLLVTTLLSALREDFQRNRDAARELEALVDQPEQRDAFHRLMASGLQETGKIDEAFEAYLKLAERPSQSVGGLSSAGPAMDEISSRLRVRRDRWIQARLSELLDVASPAQRERMDQIILRRFESAIQSDAPNDMRGFLGLFGSHPLSVQVRLRLSARLIELEELLPAELLLSEASMTAGSGEQGAIVALYARLLTTAEHYAEAAQQYVRLRDEFGDIECLDGMNGLELFQAARSDMRMTEALQSRRVWSSGMARVDDNGRPLSSYNTQSRVYPIATEDSQGPFRVGANIAYDQRRNALAVRDSMGKAIRQIPLGDGRRFYISNHSAIKCRSNGHLVLSAVGNEVMAINLLDSSQNSPEAILWRRNLTETLQANRYASTRVRTVGSTTPWGETRYTAVDASGNPIGVIGSVYNSGVCYVRLRELVCADPLTGEVIWSRSGIPAGCTLFGDGHRVFIVPPKSEKALVYSRVDGSELGERQVAPNDRRWTTLDGLELSWKQEGNTLQLRLRDPWEQRDIWSRPFPVGSKGWLVDHEEVAVAQPDGKLIILSLREDHTVLQAELQRESSLTSLYVFRSSERYHVVVSVPATSTSKVTATSIPISTQVVPLVSGKVYAFDRASGNSVWQVPAVIDRYGLPLTQPADSPVLTFLRHLNQPSSAAGRRFPTRGSILCLDKRDGRILLQDDNIATQIHSFEIVADQARQQVRISLPGKLFTIQFTDDPAPPEPPAQTGVPRPAQTLSDTGRALRSFAGALFDALTPSAKTEPKPKEPGPKKDGAAAPPQAQRVQTANGLAPPAAKKPAAKEPVAKEPADAGADNAKADPGAKR